jgi:CRP/FNR family transcriptional regulator, anaerobic regulatory protein
VSLDQATLQRLREAYPVLAALPPAEAELLKTPALQHLRVPAGTRLFDEGTQCQGFPLLLAGAVRVARGSAGGRQLELYRVTAGETCVVSTASLVQGQGLSARGDTTEATELVLVSPAVFERWCEVGVFRRHVFGMFASRLADLMALAEAVAFQRLDQRLAQALLGRGDTVVATHQALADELGTVREIVSRLLNRFERQGWVGLGRERIQIVDVAALRALAAGDAPAASA